MSINLANLRIPATARPQAAWPRLLLAGALLCVGCTESRPSAQTQFADSTTASPAQPARIYAQGLIMPADGIVKIYAAPGDAVVELPVQVGSLVKHGDTLAVMKSLASVEAQRTALVERRRTAIDERDNAVRQAELKVTAAQLKLQQVQSQKQSLDQQTGLLNDAQQQVALAEKILTRLTNISADDLTHEFVGQLEIDRQRLAVEQARSLWAEKKSTRDDAESNLKLADEAARAELSAAETMLNLAKQADPATTFDAQLKALDAELSRATIQAANDGVILAINAAVGGSVTTAPLIEMANVESMVCELEVNVNQAQWVQPGQTVTIESNSLAQPLTGKVQEKGQLVGQPQLRSPDPLAAVDYRTLSVIVALDNPAAARQWVRLQVDAYINIGSTN